MRNRAAWAALIAFSIDCSPAPTAPATSAPPASPGKHPHRTVDNAPLDVRWPVLELPKIEDTASAARALKQIVTDKDPAYAARLPSERGEASPTSWRSSWSDAPLVAWRCDVYAAVKEALRLRGVTVFGEGSAQPCLFEALRGFLWPEQMSALLDEKRMLELEAFDAALSDALRALPAASSRFTAGGTADPLLVGLRDLLPPEEAATITLPASSADDDPTRGARLVRFYASRLLADTLPGCHWPTLRDRPEHFALGCQLAERCDAARCEDTADHLARLIKDPTCLPSGTRRSSGGTPLPSRSRPS